MEFKNLKECVEYVLRNHSETAIDDFTLIYYTYYYLGYLDKNKYFSTIMQQAYKKKYPAFESITRARRELMNDYPELQDIKTQQKRRLAEQNVRKYYRNKK